MEIIGRSNHRATRIASSEFGRANERKLPRQQKLQHPARSRSTNGAAWQRMAGRGVTRDSSVDARGSVSVGEEEAEGENGLYERAAFNVSVER